MTGTVVLRTTDQYIKAELEAIHPVYKVKAFKVCMHVSGASETAGTGDNLSDAPVVGFICALHAVALVYAGRNLM